MEKHLDDCSTTGRSNFLCQDERMPSKSRSMRLCISVYQSRTLIIRLFLKPLGFMLINIFCFYCLKINATKFKHCTVYINENSSEKSPWVTHNDLSLNCPWAVHNTPPACSACQNSNFLLLRSQFTVRLSQKM